MYITTPDSIIKTVDDYDFSFTNGMMLPVSIDKAAGDTVDFETYPNAIKIHLVEKKSLVDPDKSLPAEDITIFITHVLSIHHRERQITELTPEQKFEHQKLMKELTGFNKTIQ